MSIRFSKSRASELNISSGYTGCAVSASLAYTYPGIFRVPIKDFIIGLEGIATGQSQTGYDLANLQAYSNDRIFDNINQASICSSQLRLQGEIMDKIMRKAKIEDALQNGMIPISYATILKKARCK